MTSDAVNVRDKAALIIKLSAQIEEALPRGAVTIGHAPFPIRTFTIGDPLLRIREDAAKVLANLPRGF